MNSPEDIAEQYTKREKHRSYRDKWIAVGMGGIAIGGVVTMATGRYDIGGAIAACSTLAVLGPVLDTQNAINDTQKRIDRRTSQMEIMADGIPPLENPS